VDRGDRIIVPAQNKDSDCMCVCVPKSLSCYVCKRNVHSSILFPPRINVYIYMYIRRSTIVAVPVCLSTYQVAHKLSTYLLACPNRPTCQSAWPSSSPCTIDMPAASTVHTAQDTSLRRMKRDKHHHIANTRPPNKMWEKACTSLIALPQNRDHPNLTTR
jgi:hypothetical protein